MPKLSKPSRWTPRPDLLCGPTIPDPMHEVNPRTILGQAWWDQTRRAAYERTDFHCAACGVWKHEARGKRWLEGHEVYDIDYVTGTIKLREVVGLCHYCHSFIHIGRLHAMLERREIGQSQYTAVIRHGNRVLAAAGLKRPAPYDGPTAEWGRWRLIIGRRRYPPKFRTREDWIRNFSPEENIDA